MAKIEYITVETSWTDGTDSADGMLETISIEQPESVSEELAEMQRSGPPDKISSLNQLLNWFGSYGWEFVHLESGRPNNAKDFEIQHGPLEVSRIWFKRKRE